MNGGNNWPILLRKEGYAGATFTHHISTNDPTLCVVKRQDAKTKRTTCPCGHYRIVWLDPRKAKNPWRK